MKTATILPQGLLGFAKHDDYHMALGHLIQAEGYEMYTDFFTDIGHDPEKFLILDTGLIEGNARPTSELIQKAIDIHADEMILNDVFEDREATLLASHNALLEIESEEGNFSIRKMAVPQGVDAEDWLECAKEMLTWPIDTIGIPKVLTRDGGSHARLWALEKIQPFLGDKEVHLLGCWESPLELQLIENYTRAGKIKPVRGVDSAIAYVYAAAGIGITEDARPEGAIDFKTGQANIALLAQNIDIWKDAAKSMDPIAKVREEKVIRLK